ncbi:hypothetical protein IFM89_012528 [Coptis chinensis]|uniref:Tetratricopeptide repeat protein 5 OB fold domain-containing protein n=1 Tax=Coptis chinensis TaxID=261450 RepID=A0A835LRH2_9MAGN|nr:hypothetical protein IFM89_012528 [Coptis chinensis]
MPHFNAFIILLSKSFHGAIKGVQGVENIKKSIVASPREMSTHQNEDGDEDVMKKVTLLTEDLYHLRDTYFPVDPQEKISKLQNHVNFALSLLDSIPSEQWKSTSQRANFEFLRGKILDVFPDYRKEAEDHLSKAVKLNPSFADAWLCFGTDNQVQMVEDSIRHAKEAIALDVKDGNSWYNLGNACLTRFFVTGACDHTKLLPSLKAYQNAEKDESMKSNPDLYFNSATVNKYLENYERALTGFQAAALKDPGLNASEEVEKMGLVRGKRLASLASSLSEVNLNSSHKKLPVRLLLEGVNKEVVVTGKVLLFIKHDSVAPLYYLLCDPEQTYFVLSVYGLRADVITEGDQLTVVAPYFRDVNFLWNSKQYQFKSIRVDFLEQVIRNGKALAPHQAAQTSIYAEHKP